MIQRVRAFFRNRQHRKHMLLGGTAFVVFFTLREFLKQEHHNTYERPDTTFNLSHDLIILCGDVRCGGGKKQIAYKERCPKCGSKEVISASTIAVEVKPWRKDVA